MDSFEVNKILGAILGACLVLLITNFTANALFAPQMPAKPGFVIAVNAPAAKKDQYWTNDELPETVDEWQKGAKEHPGSWWPDWDAWLSKLSGKKIPARKPGDGKLKPLGNAPGSYVKIKAQ